MKNVYSKKITSVFLSLVMILTLLVPFISNAATGTLGSETPNVYATFVDTASGEEVDGNKLANGTYDVSIWLSGMAEFATLQLTADYTPAELTINSTSDLISDTAALNLKSAGVVAENGTFATGFFSTNSGASAVNSDGQLIIKLNITVNTESTADFAELFVLKTDPRATLIEADYGDYEDYTSPNQSCYALVTSFDGYTGTLYRMTADLSPASGHSVSGSIAVMTNSTGSTSGAAPYGVYTIDVYSDSQRTQLVKTVESICDWDAKTNTFVIEGLVDGTYYLTISSEYAITRNDVTVEVKGSDITEAQIPIVACDFNKDQSTTVLDSKFEISAASSENQANYQYCDMNADGSLSVLDVKVVLTLSTGDLNYPAIAIK